MDRAAYINLDAISHNISTFKKHTKTSVMVVVKANAYGHASSADDIAEIVAAAEIGGADYAGVAHVDEAITLRKAGVKLPILAWLHTPTSNFAQATDLDIEIGISSYLDLTKCTKLSKTPVVHIKLDTGLGRNGITKAEQLGIFTKSLKLQEQGVIKVKGIFSHFAVADEPTRTETTEQLNEFKAAIKLAKSIGLEFEVKHIANTAAAITRPDTYFDMVRVGIGAYGLKPLATDLPLQPTMTFKTYISKVKKVEADQGVSYGLNYKTKTETTLGLVPVGYADGIPRTSKLGPVKYRGRTYQVIGNVAMDQVVIDFEDSDSTDYEVNASDQSLNEVIVFGDTEPTADDWGKAAGTINYEIVTRIGARVPRVLMKGGHAI
ncbi:MAG: alanine racemase [Micrococcaceae bacterium]